MDLGGLSLLLTMTQLRVNETAHGRFDVVVAATERQTKYRASLEKFAALPAWIRDLKLPGGLCLEGENFR